MENIKIEKQENKEEIKNMENVITDTQETKVNTTMEIQEAEVKTNDSTTEIQETEANTNYTEDIQFKINEYKTIIANKAYMFAPLTVAYNDLKVLIDKTPELELVDYFFDSISCRR